MAASPDTKMKVVMLGKEATGKTSLVERFLSGRFQGEGQVKSTIAGAYGGRKLVIDGQSVLLGVWDTAGSERFESITRMYYRDASAAVVCFAVNDAASWERLKFWVSELRREEAACRIYVAATKVDLLQGSGQSAQYIRGGALNKNRAVEFATTQTYCRQIGAQLFETSSKEGTNIETLFQQIARDFLENVGKQGSESPAVERVKLSKGKSVDKHEAEDSLMFDCSGCVKPDFKSVLPSCLVCAKNE